jgi:iron(III) transport system ATP-binding protein
MADLVLENLVRSYGLIRAVDDISLTVKEQEFLTLLGPSGCGKSTTLSMIAGLDRPTSGTIRIGGEVLYDESVRRFVPPERRNIGMVFQSYALWPHMTVTQNLAFPLKLRKIKAAQQKTMIEEALGLVEMLDYRDRFPFELSGGQQQRVALARALVYRPSILLLDEPLSNLDAKLRERARIWLRELQTRLKLTTIYVTHDQAEALAVSDRIAVMSGGKIRQLGTPLEIYENPQDEFVADFIGSSNFIPAVVIAPGEGQARVRLADGSELTSMSGTVSGGENVLLSVRPERIELAQGPGENSIEVAVESASYLGSVYNYEVSRKDIRFRVQSPQVLGAGPHYVYMPTASCRLFPDLRANA